MLDFLVANLRPTTIDLQKKGDASLTPLTGESSTTLTGNVGDEWEAFDQGKLVGNYSVSSDDRLWNVYPFVTRSLVNLQPYDAGDFNESLDTKSEFLAPIGDLTIAILFVDFQNNLAKESASDIERRITASVLPWLETESFSAVTPKVTGLGGWKTLPKDVADFDIEYAEEVLLSETLKLFPTVDFDQFKLVLVIAARTNNGPFASTNPMTVGITTNASEFRAQQGEVKHAIVFGNDFYTRDHYLLLHEMCHLFGLPDLYDGGVGNHGDAGFLRLSGAPSESTQTSGYSAVGVDVWDLMADVGGRHLLGWHRLKLRWLKKSQVICVDRTDSFEFDLAGWTTPVGVKLIVVPVAMEKLPSLAFVFEVAQHRGATSSPGLLAYSVNAAVPSFMCPIQIRGGKDRFQALPIPVGEFFEHVNGPNHNPVRVEVLANVADGFRVKFG